MPARKYTDQQRQAALDLVTTLGNVSEAARRSEIPKGTLSTWLRDAGIKTSDTNKSRGIGLERSLQQRRSDLSDKLLKHAEWLADRAVNPQVEDKDRGRIAVACAVFVDKHQLMSGGVTSRAGTELDLTDRDSRLEFVRNIRSAPSAVREDQAS